MSSIINFLALFTFTLAHEEPIVFINPYFNANSEFAQTSKLTRRLLNQDRRRLNTLSSEAKEAILDAHNDYRSSVALGETDGQPRATNMNYLLWDEGLAQAAQAWAEACTFAPNPASYNFYQDQEDANTELINGALGENLYFTSQNEISADELIEVLEDAVGTWYDQNEYYQGGEDPECTAEVTITENCRYYKQLVNAQTRYVGCAYSQCNNPLVGLHNENFNDGSNVIVCYYFEDNTEDPYTTTENDDDIASECVDSIDDHNGLCLACYPDTFCEDGLGRNPLNFDDADNNDIGTQHPTSHPTERPTPEPTTPQPTTPQPTTPQPTTPQPTTPQPTTPQPTTPQPTTPQPTTEEPTSSPTTESPTVTPRECGRWTRSLRYTAAARNSRDVTSTADEDCCNQCIDDDECVGASFSANTQVCTLFTSIRGSNENSRGWRSMMIL